MSNYTVLHCHTEQSLLDSCTNYKLYVDKCVEFGQKAIAFTEHGNTNTWIEKKMYCDEKGIKFIFGVECYLTETLNEKIRDNYHTILLAKNYDGIKEINRLMYNATQDDHFYYKPRISFDEFLDISDNVIKISACLASPLNSYRLQIHSDDRLFAKYDYYEIQPHNNDEQKDYNIWLVEKAKQYNKPLVATGDFHSSDDYKSECRKVFQLGSEAEFSKDDDYDLTYKNYDDFKKAFEIQGVLNNSIILEALENTNVIADVIESITLDTSFKYPILYGDKDEEVLMDTLRKKYSDKVRNGIIDPKNAQQYVDNINEEMRVFKKVGMTGFMLFMSEMITWCWDNNIPVGFCRGCFTKDAIIQTKTDLKTLDKVQIGDKVLSADGLWHKVLNKMSYDICEDMIQFEYFRQGSSYKKYINKCTTDHKILVNRDGDIDYIQASELKVGDLLCSPKIKHNNENEIIIDLLDYNVFNYKYDENYIYEEVYVNNPLLYSSRWCAKHIGGNVVFWKRIAKMDSKSDIAQQRLQKLFELTPFNNIEEYRAYIRKNTITKRAIPRYIKFDYLWNVFIGLMYGDGWTQSNYALGLAVNRGTKNVFNRYVFTKIANRLGLEVYTNSDKNRNLDQLFLNSKIIKQWFSSMFFESKKGVSKHFNEELYNQSATMLKGIYVGLLRSDGSRNKTNLSFDNTSTSIIQAFRVLDNIITQSEPLALDVRMAHIDHRGYKNKESYKLRRPLYPQRKRITCNDDYWFLPITNIQLKHNEKNTVYDLTIENNPSYTINNIVVHNSCGGSTVAYLSDIIDVDPIKWHTIFSRFCNEDRVEIGDIDIDVSPDQRDLVYDYIINRFGKENTAFILANGTVVDKGTIDVIGKAFRIKWNREHNLNDKYTGDDNPFNLSKIKQIKDEYELDATKAKEQYSDIFYYFDGILNTIKSQSMHPAGILASPVNLVNEYGCFNKDGKNVICINMEECHEVSLVKYDILSLRNIQVIRDTCRYANIPYPKSHLVDWEDKEVWEHICDSPVGIFQFESQYASECLKKMHPTKINDMSMANAALRPSGESYRDRLFAGETNHNPSEQIDELLKDNRGFLCFQEDTIKFLQNICGLSGSEADNVRRAIGRKQIDRLQKALPQILEGYCNKSDKPREIAEQEACTFLQIIEDSSNYQFGYNHSTGYSMIGYVCAYLRYYYPLEFCTSLLNNAGNDEDLANATELASSYGISILSPKFGKSKAQFFMDKEHNSIYKGVGSIKDMNAEIADNLYNLSQSGEIHDIFDILCKPTAEVGNRKQLRKLIKIGYFEQFGDINTLLYAQQIYDTYGKRKTLKKPFEYNIEGLFTKETEKQYSGIDSIGVCKVVLNNTTIPKLPKREGIAYQLCIMGYSSECIPDEPINHFAVQSLITTKYNTYLRLYRLYDGEIVEVKVDKKYFESHPIDTKAFEKEFDKVPILKCSFTSKQKRRKIDDKWVATGEYESILSAYTEI